MAKNLNSTTSSKNKYRGKGKYTDLWYYGDLIHLDDKVLIADQGMWALLSSKQTGDSTLSLELEVAEVDPETVGQFTGTQINKQDLYEGDIVGHYVLIFDTMKKELRHCYPCIYGIESDYPAFSLKGMGVYDCNSIQYIITGIGDWIDDEYEHFKIIGNIHDNPGMATQYPWEE